MIFQRKTGGALKRNLFSAISASTSYTIVVYTDINLFDTKPKRGQYRNEKIKIHLKATDRKRLNEFVKKGEAKARKITRCHILLLSDKKESNGKISRTLNIALLTIRRIQQRYVEGGLESAIEERPRSGKPPKFNGKQQAKITALACSTPPEGRSRWTLRLLADKVVQLDLVDDISYKTVGEILKKTKSSRT